MKHTVKRRLQEMLLEAVSVMPEDPEPNISDTTLIAQWVCKKYTRELIKMGIIDDSSDAFWKSSKFLLQLNNLHRDGKILKKIEYGGKETGHSFTIIRWGDHAR